MNYNHETGLYNAAHFVQSKDSSELGVPSIPSASFNGTRDGTSMRRKKVDFSSEIIPTNGFW